MSEGKITIEVLLDSKNFKDGVSKLSGLASKGIKPAMKTMGVATAAVTGFAGAAINAGMQYESAFAGVKKTVDATEAEYKQLSDGIRDMAKEMPQSAAEIASVAEAAGQLGIHNDAILTFTKTMTQLGDATNLSSEEAATSLARFANIMGMSQQNFDKLGSTIVNLGNNLATTESEIVMMGMRVAGAGKQVGMTESQVMSWSAAMSSVGISAEAGGTAFSNGIKRMNAAVSEGGTKLQQFADIAGMSKEEFAQLFKQDSSAAMDAFIAGLADISESGGDLLGTLKEIGFSDVRISDAFARLASGHDVVTKALEVGNKGWEENNALTKEVANRYSTLESQIAILRNQVVDIGIDIYQSTSGPLNSAVKTASSAIKKISKEYKKGGSNAAAEAAGQAMGKMLASASKYVPKLAALGVKGLKSFASGLYKNRGEIVKAAKQLVTTLADSIGEILPGSLGNAFKNVGHLVAAAIGPMTEIAGVALKVASAMSNLLPILAGVMGAFKLNSLITNFVLALKLLKVGQDAATASTLANTLAMKVNDAAKIASAAKTAILTVATSEMTIAQKAAAVATTVLNGALTMFGGPAGLAVAALGALAGAAMIFGDKFANAGYVGKQADSISKLADEVDELTGAYERNSKARKDAIEDSAVEADLAEKYTDRLKQLAKNHHKSASEIEEERTLVEQLNELIPDLNLKYDEEKDKINKSTDSIYKKIEAMKKEAQVAAIQDAIIETTKEQLKLDKEEQKTAERAAKAREDYENKKKEIEASRQNGNVSGSMEVLQNQQLKAYEDNAKKAEEQHAKTQKALNESKQDLDYYNGLMNEAVNGASEKTAKAAVNLDSLAQELGIKAGDIPKSIYNGIQNGIMAMPTTGAELQTLIDYTSLEAKATEAGIKIPKSITNGIKAGGPQAATAVKQLNNLLKFEPLKKKAEAAGVHIPKSVTKGIRTGKYAIPKSMDELKKLIKLDGLEKKGEKHGKGYGKSVGKGMESSKGDVKKATEKVTSEAGKGADKAKKTFSKSGQGNVQEYNKSLSKGKPKSVATAKNISNATGKAFGSGKGSATSAGRNVVNGFISGLRSGSNSAAAVARSIVRRAIAAMNSEADSHSPSKKTEKLGKWMYQGLCNGLISGDVKVSRAASKLVQAALKSASNVTDNYSDIGSQLVSDLSDSIEKRQNAITRKFDKVAEKAKKKAGKSGKKAINAITKQLNKALEAQRDKLVKAAEETFAAISDKYQEQYNDLVSKSESLTSSLRGYGSMLAETANSAFSATFGRINEYSLGTTMRKRLKSALKFNELYAELKSQLPEDLMSEILGLGDTEALTVLKKFSRMSKASLDSYLDQYRQYKDQLDQITAATATSSDKNVMDVLLDKQAAKKKYEEYVDQLRAYADTEDLGEAVLGMGVEEGTKFLEQFFGLTEQERRDYIQTWNDDYKDASQYAEKYYKDQFETVKTDYNTEMAAAATEFRQTMDDVGKETVEGFIAGLKAKQDDASKVMTKIIKKAIKAAKKALKIKSPSRVFDEIGQLTIEGAEQGSQREAKNLYNLADDVAVTFSDRFQAAMSIGTLDTSSIYEAAASVQSVNPLLKNQLLAGSEAAAEAGEDRFFEFHFHTNLNGREVAHETARFMNTELGQMKELNARC